VVPPLAVSVSSIVLITIAVLSVVVLVLIVVAPWKRVREEPPLDKDVETRLLLHRPNPEEATGEIPTTRVSDLTERTGDAPTPASDDADFAELRDLDD
jgi:cell division protein FtsN